MKRRPYMRVRKVVMAVVCVLIYPCFACGSNAVRVTKGNDGSVRAALARAIAERNPAASSVVAKVLMDILQRTYKYGSDTRISAFQAVADLELRSLVDTVRAVAVLTIGPERGYKQTWDLIAVQGALNALTTLRDPEAVSLNRRRVESDPWLQSTAISNLATLADWASTGDVAHVLRCTKADEENLFVVATAAQFLDESPNTDREVCERLHQLERRYPDCMKAPDSLVCSSLGKYVKSLEARLRCATVPAPGAE
jgi:hypothetical protein